MKSLTDHTPTAEELAEIAARVSKSQDRVEQLQMRLARVLSINGPATLTAADAWRLHSFIGGLRVEADVLADHASEIEKLLEDHVLNNGLRDA